MIRLSGFWHDWEVAFCATWLVVTALCSESFRRFLLGRMPQFLGRISYSLYLVHGTVLFALVHLLYGKVRLIAILPLYLPLAITMAVLLHKLVEAPSMEVGRRVGYWLGPRLLPAPARVPAD
jgi:peptidoglycan/LPS O-acetylase OafA/YrhL